MNITAADVNKLRMQTGAGRMDCKKALTEANGDFEEAVVILRKKGQKVSASRADRQANEGIVVALTNDAQTRGLLLELNCETDFVAKNEDFTSLARKLAEHCMAHGLGSVEALLPTTMDGAVVSDLLVEYTGKIDMREQRRELRMKFVSNVTGGDYQLGKVIVNADLGDVRGYST